MSTPFTIHHLRFTVEVLTAIEMSEFKGSALRGAWQSHLRTLYCAQQGSSDLLHQSLCPVCYLLSRETAPDDNRRPYAFEPPLTRQALFQAGEQFDFGLSIFGRAIQFLPYIVFSIQQMGQSQGLGRPIHGGRRRGTFRLLRIAEGKPDRSARPVRFTLFTAGDPMIQMPQTPVTAEWVAERSRELAGQLAASGSLLTLEFLTPTRIIQEERLVHRPEFAPFFVRLVDRVGMLRAQFSAEPPVTYEEKGALLALARGVALVRNETEWWDVKGHSTRLERPQPMGGFIGRATYRAAQWAPLLPWLLWGASAHVGKNAVKGGGWYRLGY